MTDIDRDYAAERDYDGPRYAYPPRFMPPPRPTWVLVVGFSDSVASALSPDEAELIGVIGPFDTAESARAYYQRYSAAWTAEPAILGLWSPITEEVNA